MKSQSSLSLPSYNPTRTLLPPSTNLNQSLNSNKRITIDESYNTYKSDNDDDDEYITITHHSGSNSTLQAQTLQVSSSSSSDENYEKSSDDDYDSPNGNVNSNSNSNSNRYSNNSSNSNINININSNSNGNSNSNTNNAETGSVNDGLRNENIVKYNEIINLVYAAIVALPSPPPIKPKPKGIPLPSYNLPKQQSQFSAPSPASNSALNPASASPTLPPNLVKSSKALLKSLLSTLTTTLTYHTKFSSTTPMKLQALSTIIKANCGVEFDFKTLVYVMWGCPVDAFSVARNDEFQGVFDGVRLFDGDGDADGRGHVNVNVLSFEFSDEYLKTSTSTSRSRLEYIQTPVSTSTSTSTLPLITRSILSEGVWSLLSSSSPSSPSSSQSNSSKSKSKPKSKPLSKRDIQLSHESKKGQKAVDLIMSGSSVPAMPVDKGYDNGSGIGGAAEIDTSLSSSSSKPLPQDVATDTDTIADMSASTVADINANANAEPVLTKANSTVHQRVLAKAKLNNAAKSKYLIKMKGNGVDVNGSGNGNGMSFGSPSLSLSFNTHSHNPLSTSQSLSSSSFNSPSSQSQSQLSSMNEQTQYISKRTLATLADSLRAYLRTTVSDRKPLTPKQILNFEKNYVTNANANANGSASSSASSSSGSVDFSHQQPQSLLLSTNNIKPQRTRITLQTIRTHINSLKQKSSHNITLLYSKKDVLDMLTGLCKVVPGWIRFFVFDGEGYAYSDSAAMFINNNYCVGVGENENAKTSSKTNSKTPSSQSIMNEVETDDSSVKLSAGKARARVRKALVKGIEINNDVNYQIDVRDVLRGNDVNVKRKSEGLILGTTSTTINDSSTIKRMKRE